MPLNVIRRNLIYVGGAKQGAWGTAVAPTWFYWWKNGTKERPVIKYTDEREGDTSPFETLAYKDSQYREVTIVENSRPIMSGYALQSLMGTGSDAYTAPTLNTTLSSSVVAGATQVTLVANPGNVGTLAVNLSPSYSYVSANPYEVVTLDLTTRSGTGPWTFTIAAAGVTKFGHASGQTVTSASTHVFTRQPLTYDPYTLEFAYGSATSAVGQAIRIRDAVCTSLQIKCSKGKPIQFQHTWYGAVGLVQNAFLTPVYEGQNIPGQAGSPFIFYQGSGNWKINNLTTNNAATIEDLTVTVRNSTSAEDLVSENLTPVYFLPSNVTISGSARVQFQSFQQYFDTYYGSTAPATGSTDGFLMGYESLNAQFNADAVNTLALALPNIYYTGAELDPGEDAMALRQTLAWKAIKSPAQPVPITVTLTNSQTGAY